MTPARYNAIYESLAYKEEPNKDFLTKEIEEECLKLMQKGKRHATEKIKDLAVLLHFKYSTSQKDICKMTGKSKGVVSKWMSKHKIEEEDGVKLIKTDNETEKETEPEKETEETTETEPEIESEQEDTDVLEPIPDSPFNFGEGPEIEMENEPDETEEKISPKREPLKMKVLYFVAGLLSFAYLLNAEMNFYMTTDAETLALFSIKNELFWLSAAKAFIVLSGIIISVMANNKPLLYVLSAYTLAVSIIVGWNNMSEKETLKQQKEKETVLKSVENENKTLFELKNKTQSKIEQLEARINEERRYKQIHVKNKAYGHVKQSDDNINFLERKLTNVENKRDKILSKIDQRAEKIKETFKGASAWFYLWVAFLASICMKVFALCIKIVSFSRLARLKET